MFEIRRLSMPTRTRRRLPFTQLPQLAAVNSQLRAPIFPLAAFSPPPAQHAKRACSHNFVSALALLMMLLVFAIQPATHWLRFSTIGRQHIKMNNASYDG